MLAWAVWPYVSLAVFAVGMWWRLGRARPGWTSKSSELLEKRWLGVGSRMLHGGLAAVLAGHAAGLLVPVSWYRAIGVPDVLYHAVAVTAGTAAGAVALFGAVVLAARRLLVRRIRATSSPGDWLALVLLLVVMTTGLAATIGHASDESFDYRETVAPWLRGLLTLRPDPSLMENVPLLFRVHVFASFALYAALPWTRLVHAFGFPVSYVWRNDVLFRRRGRG